MRTKLSFMSITDTSRRQVKFDFTVRTVNSVTLHLTNKNGHIFGFYLFDIDYEGMYLHKDVGKEIFGQKFDLGAWKRLKVIGVDLL